MRKIFRELISVEEARAKFYEHAPLALLKSEEVKIRNSLGRVLANDLLAPINIPPFDRASMDGFAVKANDIMKAEEGSPITLQVVGEVKAGHVYEDPIVAGTCVEISTGAPLPFGADAVVMVEYTKRNENIVEITQNVTPGENIMLAGTDIKKGELILSSGIIITSRELAVISALGLSKIEVIRYMKVGVFSSGDEVVSVGKELLPGKLFDINSNAIIANLMEIGSDAHNLGIIIDEEEIIHSSIKDNLNKFDLLIISGGTSAGMGDILYKILDDIGHPGLLVHGIKVKPGKPTILAVCHGTPVIGLPGYPASALSIFKLFVVPYVRLRSGLPQDIIGDKIMAITKQKLRSVMGRHEFKPVNLINVEGKFVIYPVPGGSGAITSVALADGFIEIPENQTMIEAGAAVEVLLISPNVKVPDIQIVGVHDDILVKAIQMFTSKYPDYKCRFIATGATGGVAAIRRGEAHIASVNLIGKDGTYNNWILENVKGKLIQGRKRKIGMISLKNNATTVNQISDLSNSELKMINRKLGTNIREFFDQKISKLGIPSSSFKGYEEDVSSDTAAIQAIKSGVADVGFISGPVSDPDLDFVVIGEEQLDFLISTEFEDNFAVQKFQAILSSDEFRRSLFI